MNEIDVLLSLVCIANKANELLSQMIVQNNSIEIVLDIILSHVSPALSLAVYGLTVDSNAEVYRINRPWLHLI